MATPTVENYLKSIYTAQRASADDATLIPIGQVAEAMQVSPGTATSMMKTLADAGLAHYEPRIGVRLTEQGASLALQVLRRHRLIELFLVETLGLDWTEVHAEAEELEHAISDKVLERMDQMLGHPDTDPHGDPIPPSTGPPAHINLIPLSAAKAGQTVTISRIVDQAPGFLQFVDQHHLTPGSQVVIRALNATADAVICEPTHGSPVTLGSVAAEKILILPETTGP